MQVFPPDEVLMELDYIPLLILMGFYSFALYKASIMISDGCELLLALYGPGIIGGLVIPALGGFPDCIIILISGLSDGTRAEVQQNLAVGVGTLAGSTIMLLTIPWAVGVWLGRRDIEGSNAGEIAIDGRRKPRYTEFTWSQTGVTAFDDIPVLATTMMVTSLLYVIVQVPAWILVNDAKDEKLAMLFAFILAFLSFLIHSVYQLRSGQSDHIVEQQHREAQRMLWAHRIACQFPPGKALHLQFQKYDVNGDNQIDRSELVKCLIDLGLKADRTTVNAIMKEMDIGDATTESAIANDGRISFAEFQRFFSKAIMHNHASKKDVVKGLIGQLEAVQRPSENIVANAVEVLEQERQESASSSSYLLYEDPAVTERLVNSSQRILVDESATTWDDDCDEEEKEDETIDLTDNQIRWQALQILGAGLCSCIFFSDPMVATINIVANKAGISPFYISFIVTPIVSNASETISCLRFAAKKNKHGISLMFGAIYGAACMNNTLALSIFLGLITFRGLSWNFTAEVIAILVVTFIVGMFGRRPTIRMWQAPVVLSLYPASLGLIMLLKSINVR